MFFFPCAVNRAWGVGQCSTGSKWRKLFCVLVLKGHLKRKKGGWCQTGVQSSHSCWIFCGMWHLWSQTFFLWWVLTLNLILHEMKTSETVFRKSFIVHEAWIVYLCCACVSVLTVSSCKSTPLTFFRAVEKQKRDSTSSRLLRGNTDDTSSIAFMLHSISLTWCHP